MEIDPEKLRHFRKNLRALSQVRLSARSGIPRETLARYESGASRPRPRNFRRLYIALGCGPEDLLKARFRQRDLIDQNARRRGIATASDLSPGEALYTLSSLVEAARWTGTAGRMAEECLAVLRDAITDA